MNTEQSSIEQLLLRNAEYQTALLDSIEKSLWWLLVLFLSSAAGFLTWAILVAT